MDCTLNICTLYSSSKGNSVYIESPDTRVLIDAGGSARSLDTALRAVGGDAASLDAVFVTHAHSDHTSALATLMKQYHIPVHMTEETAACYRAKAGASVDTVVCHPRVYECRVGALTVSSFATPHDSAGSVGYTVSCGDERFGLATDMGYVTREVYERLCGCTRVIVESNYDDDMLARGSYPPYLKSRIVSRTGHLSNAGCAQLICALAGKGVSAFMLGHLSEENNTPECALAASCSALSGAGLTDGVRISVADRHVPTVFD